MLFLWVAPIKAHAEHALLNRVTYGNQSNGSLVFQLSAMSHHRYFVMSNPDRLVIDFLDTHLAHHLIQPPVDHPFFEKLKMGEHNNGKDLRIVIQLKEKVEASDNQIKKENGSELQFNVLSKEKPLAKAEKIKIPEHASPDVMVKKAKQKEPEEHASKRVNLPDPKLKGRDIVVAIDAGHGGKDVGAEGGNGTQEKDVVFEIAKRLESLVNSQPGMKALMIRKGDYFVNLHERVNIAHAGKADLFVSIHADAFNDSSAHGASVYTLANKGASSAGARWLADSENAVDNDAGNGGSEKNETLASVLQDLSKSAAKEASQNVGNKVLKNVRLVGHVHRSSVQKAGFVVLKSQDIPSILVETAFISNPEEEDHLNSRIYQEKMASAVFSGIMAHFKQYAPANTLLAQLSKAGKINRLAVLSEDLKIDDKKAGLQIAALSAKSMESNKSRHVVNRGETLSGIAQQYGISMRALRLANNMSDGNVKIGGVLQIPHNG
ncbi:N-acetylmuramoyl-L-alanine amidase [Methylomonas sp. AM2-LC]|uniref:N-acetylmuramoyl-L-alanine amidase n=1 Tax=Methylomonas sp. AM2-LC TaxID=3153301 RepID=UPI003267C9B0